LKINQSVRLGLSLGFTIILIFSATTPITIGYNIKMPDKQMIMVENYNCYHHSELSTKEQCPIQREDLFYNNVQPEVASNEECSSQILDGPMDSPWPMYCHDTRHTGQSPYSTAGNQGTEKWRFNMNYYASGSSVIDEDDIIYIGGYDLYAVYPNGTMKWQFASSFNIASAPAIDKNGILYVGSIYMHPNYLYAIYTSNGTLKWKYYTEDSIYSSPSIGEDGTIYFGYGSSGDGGYITALYPNGTLKWQYLTGVAVLSSPAIGQDGTVYCGSHDTYLYALYPNNGTLKWKFGTGGWIRTSPCIADDGTIYVVSLDNYLYAINPDGTLKWKTNVGAGTSPTIGQDGAIYCGWDHLYAVNPTNGSIKWSFDPGGVIDGGTPCNSLDGAIIFGTQIGELDGGELIAVNPDGTLRWRIMLATDFIDSAPAIGSDGTVYVGSDNDAVHPGSLGYLHAINTLDPDAPSAPEIRGTENGKINIQYKYTFRAYSHSGKDVYYWIEWGDGGWTDWIGPYSSGEEITLNHTWSQKGTYTIKARCNDTDNLWGPWGELTVTMPRSRVTTNLLFLRFLERFPLLEKLLFRFLG